jgi:hypothetical protein
MYGLTRATITLIAAGTAGFLIWIAGQFNLHKTSGYWWALLLVAAAGLVLALSQLLGGWTKWGWPRISMSVFLWAFVPAFICAGWIIIFHQPHPNGGRNHIVNWSGDIHVRGIVRDFGPFVTAVAFGLGLLFGFALDTSGPVTGAYWRRRRAATPPPQEAPPA